MHDLAKWSSGLSAGVAGLALLCAGAATAQTADSFVVKRATELRVAPGDASASAGPLAAQTPVTRSAARQGAWVEVRTTQGGVGWLHMFDLAPASGSAVTAGGTGAGAGTGSPAGGNVATGTLRGLSNFFNRGSAQPQPNAGGTSTVGIRGLSAEDLSRSQPNMAAVTQAEALRQTGDQARNFAADAQLTAQAVEPLPLPASTNANRQGNSP